MNIERVALITFHACPLVAPGQGKAGGMNVYVRQLARSLGDLGIEVDIFTRNHPNVASQIEEISPNVRVVHLAGGDPETPLGDLFTYLPEFLQSFQDFRRENRSYGRTAVRPYQVLHSHYWLSGWIGHTLAQDLKLPHVVTFHTLSLIKMQSRVGEVEPLQRQRVERELLASAHCIVAFSPHERSAMVQLYNADAARIKLVPSGVDLSLFRPLDPVAARKQLGLNGEKVLLYVGRVEPLKGLELLVRTAAHLETCEELRVLVVGGDPNKDQEINRLRHLAQELKVDGVFDFVGRVDQKDLPLYYNAADVCVFPSYYESFGLAALESMACGTPVVASRVGGLPTIIQHGHTGYLKSWRCPEAFANTLEMILSSSGLQRSMGLAARRRAECMGWEKVATKIASVYESLVTEAFEELPEV